MEFKEIITYIITASGFCGLIVWLVKFNANSQQKNTGAMMEALKGIIKQGEERRKLEHDENIAVQRETANSIKIMGEGFCGSLDKLGERSGNGHQSITQSLESLKTECIIVKNSVVTTSDHVVARLNETENKIDRLSNELRDDWGKTREIVRNCDNKKNIVK